MLNNQKGLSLYELLAAIAITGFLITTILYFTNYTNSNINKISTRESLMQESRLVMSHIVNEVKQGRLDASQDSTYLLKLDEFEYQLVDNVKTKILTNDYTYYQFDASKHTVTAEKKSGEQVIHYPLSDHVSHLNIQLSDNNKRIAIDLTMLLPNSETHQTSTVVYVSQLD